MLYRPIERLVSWVPSDPFVADDPGMIEEVVGRHRRVVPKPREFVVRGEARFTGGGGGKRLVGAMIIEEPTGGSTSGVMMDIRGTIDVLFSQEAVNKVMAAFASYTILNWREGPTP